MTIANPARPALIAKFRRAMLGAGTFGFAALAMAPHSDAQVFSGHNSNAPVDYSADRIEMQEKQDRVILSGNVDVKQADLTMRAARTIVDLANTSSLKLQRITASGSVVVTRGGEVATGDVGIYDFNRKIITMVGNASLRRSNGDTLRGGRFVIDLNTNVSSASGGRVSGTFSVPKQN